MQIIGIGASAGGVDAFHGFFNNMPADSGMALIVILHLPSDRKSILQGILARWTSMPIIEITDGCKVEANSVYLPPGGGVVTFSQGHLHLHRIEEGEPKEFHPINILFNSLANALEEDAIGVVLSGTGADGSLGLKAIKEKGGLTLVQGADGSRPQHDGMPSSAIATGAVDIVASVEDIPHRIMSIQEGRRRLDTSDLSPQSIDSARLSICAIINRELGHDFSGYKDRTFLRRVQRRMQMLGVTTFAALIERLERDRHEVVMLFRDLLIGVTSFFRDDATFEVLRRTIVPLLFAGKGPDETIRAWVPGCATGEEAYSIAIVLREHADRLGAAAPKMQVFATDIDDVAIMTARAGRYPSALLQGMRQDRLMRYFVKGIDDSYTIAKSIREVCTFSTHSLTRDPPFSRMDLLSCRNLLIYLDLDLQGLVIPAFHYALVPDGILLLGSSEAINRHESLFKTLDRSHRIFQKRDVISPTLHLTGPTTPRETTPARAATGSAPVRMPTARSANWAQLRVLDRFAPPFVVVTADGTAAQFSGRLTRYLDLPTGAPSQNVFVMARKGLQTPLRAGLKQAVQTGRSIETPDVLVIAADGSTERITLVVEPQREQGKDPLFLIVFTQPSSIAAKAATSSDAHEIVPDSSPDRHLEAELRETREQLQSITEEHDTALEELRSANEELHSVNEELQSTNEELETSREEIQSINEELQTVNGQLAAKVDELDHNNSDLRNLFESTQVATMFLDPYMIIRSFTPAIASIYNLIPSDLGRPVTDIISRLRYSDLRADCLQVLRTLEPLERRVIREDDATHYLMRILPYRTPSSSVDGTIVTFVDVTSVVQAEQHHRLLVDELNHRVKNMLTVVISIATQTLRHSKTLAEFEKTYLGRVHALSSAYSLVSRENWQTVSLRSLLLEELRPFIATDQSNVQLDGPAVQLQPRAALAFGMAIHELTTNAVKYGALSSVQGKVTVTWQVSGTRDASQLLVDWTETGGPPVMPPKHRSFGMTLIERGLKQDMAADVSVEFPETGVHAKFTVPLPASAAPAPVRAPPVT